MCKNKCILYRSFHGDVTHRVTWSSGISGWQKICCCLASRVFCRDSILVCIHFTHTQDHDFVLYWCGVHLAIVWTARFIFLPYKKGKRRKIWLNAFSCKQWARLSLKNYQPCFVLIVDITRHLLQHISTHLTSQNEQQTAQTVVFYAANRVNERCRRRHANHAKWRTCQTCGMLAVARSRHAASG